MIPYPARALTALIPCLFACAAPTPSGESVRLAPLAPKADPEIVAIHAHKCGSCHVPPEPKSHTRVELEVALLRHKNRVHLTPDQWARLIDYLADRPRTDAEASALTHSAPFR